MNRHQRRKKAIYIKLLLNIYSAIAISLNEKNKWGKKRILELFETSQNKIKLIDQNQITTDQMINICKTFKVDIENKILGGNGK